MPETEEIEEGGEIKGTPSVPALLSMEFWSIMCIAIFLDFLGLVGFIPLIGQIFSYVPGVFRLLDGLLKLPFLFYENLFPHLRPHLISY